MIAGSDGVPYRPSVSSPNKLIRQVRSGAATARDPGLSRRSSNKWKNGYLGTRADGTVAAFAAIPQFRKRSSIAYFHGRIGW